MRYQTYHGARKGGKARVAWGALAAIATATMWLRLRPFRVVVAGHSMGPALRPGDLLVATAAGPIRRGALVVAEDPRTPGFELVKRVAEEPGEGVDHRVLGPDEYWLLGDRPEQSTDSRTFGPVPRSRIRGVVRLRYWPLDRIGPIAGKA